MQQAMGSNPGFQPAEFSGFPPHFPLQAQYRIEAFICAAPVPSQNYKLRLQFLLQRQREFSTPTTKETKGLR